MFALVDVNNMYVSCERVFQPALNGKPVVVLSNNDGNCIARSNEAKDLGVKMAQPWFQVRHLERSAGLIALSANFELYGDMSSRMMVLAAGYAPRQEIYSIDECFLDFEGVTGDARRRSAMRCGVRSSRQWACRPASVSVRPRPWPSWPTMSPRRPTASRAAIRGSWRRSAISEAWDRKRWTK